MAVGVKFSDITAINQYILNRAAITLTASALTGAAVGLLNPLIPSLEKVVPGEIPILVYAAALVMPFAALAATLTIPLGGLGDMIISRIKEDTGDKDSVSTELRDSFAFSVEKKLVILRFANTCLMSGLYVLVFHAYLMFYLDSSRHLAGHWYTGSQSYYPYAVGILVFVSLAAFFQGALLRRFKSFYE